jgi:hypothetical protein
MLTKMQHKADFPYLRQDMNRPRGMFHVAWVAEICGIRKGHYSDVVEIPESQSFGLVTREHDRYC